MVLFTHKKLIFKGSKKQHQILAQTAYYQAGKIVVQTLLPEQPPVALITLNTLGTTCSTSADTYIPIENISNTQSRSFLESRLVSLYGGKAASLLIEYQQRSTSHDRTEFSFDLVKLGVREQYPILAQRSETFGGKEASEVDSFNPFLVSPHSSAAQLLTPYPFPPSGYGVKGYTEGERGSEEEKQASAAELRVPVANSFQRRDKEGKEQKRGEVPEAGYNTEKKALYSKDNVQNRVVNPFEPNALRLLRNSKAANGRRFTTRKSKKQQSVGTKALRSKARLVAKRGTYFAGTGNNIFQSTLGNIEIQTATRLARIMVNYWNFYSLNKISLYSLFKRYNQFPKVHQLDALLYPTPLCIARGTGVSKASPSYASPFTPSNARGYPSGSGIWGESLTDSSIVTSGEVAKQYLERGRFAEVNRSVRGLFGVSPLLAKRWKSSKVVKRPTLLTPFPHNSAAELLTPYPEGVKGYTEGERGMGYTKSSFAKKALLQREEVRGKDFVRKSQKNIVYRVTKRWKNFYVAQSKNSLKICENKNSSYNIQRLSVENIGNYAQLNNKNFQLINSLQFSNLQRDRFYPNWFRVYLPDIEGTEFLKNIANYYFSLGLQTLTFPSTKLSYYFLDSVENKCGVSPLCRKGTASLPIPGRGRGVAEQRVSESPATQTLTNSSGHKRGNGALRGVPPRVQRFASETSYPEGLANEQLLSSQPFPLRGMGYTESSFASMGTRLGTGGYFATSLPSGFSTASPFLTFLNKNTRRTIPLQGMKEHKLFIPNIISSSYCPPSILVNSKSLTNSFQSRGSKAQLRKPRRVVKLSYASPSLANRLSSASLVRGVWVRRFATLLTPKGYSKNTSYKSINFSDSDYYKLYTRFAKDTPSGYSWQAKKALLSYASPLPHSSAAELLTPYPFPPSGYGVKGYTEGERGLRNLPPLGYGYSKEIAKDPVDTLNVSFSLFLENQIFPLNYNGFPIVEKELLYGALVNSSFAKAFYLINQNRELLDFFVDYLLRFQILRQHQILYLFSTLLLGPNKMK